MNTMYKDKQTYLVPAIQIHLIESAEDFLGKVFTNGDPKGTGIIIETEADNSDDINFANDSFFDD